MQIFLKKIKENSQKKNKLTLKTQQIFKTESHNAFTEEINKIAVGLNDDKRLQSIDLIETYAHGTIKILYRRKKKLSALT